MPISIVCPNCQSLLQVADHLEGQVALCGHCSQPLRVVRAARPIPAPLPAPPQPPPAVRATAPFQPTLATRSSSSRGSVARSRPSNLVPLLTWVGVIGVAVAIVVAVFVEGNRRRAERRRQEVAAKVAAKVVMPS